MSTALLALLSKHKINLQPQFNSGVPVRNGSAWFIGREGRIGEKLVQWAAFGDFARNISEKWSNAGDKISVEEQEKIQEFIKDAQAKIRKDREDHWEVVRGEVEKEWALCSDLGTTPYLERKGIKSLYGCRVEPFEKGARLIVPARDVSGIIWGYQRIYSEKLSLSGTDKIFREGARKEACFHTLPGKLPVTDVLYLCEGISTAISIFLALDEQQTVISAFDAGNLLPVAEALRNKWPDTHFVFCADADNWPAKDGRIYKTGQVKAEAAAKTVGNARVVLPVFKNEY